MVSKVCTKCKIEKDIALFAKKRGLCMDCDRMRSKDYYQKNKEKCQAREKLYRINNREQALRRQKAYWWKNRETLLIYKKTYNKIYYENNKERIVQSLCDSYIKSNLKISDDSPYLKDLIEIKRLQIQLKREIRNHG